MEKGEHVSFPVMFDRLKKKAKEMPARAKLKTIPTTPKTTPTKPAPPQEDPIKAQLRGIIASAKLLNADDKPAYQISQGSYDLLVALGK